MGRVICTFYEKSTKIAAHSPTLKVGFAAEAILQGVMLAQYQQNIIVSFSLQSDTTLLSLEQCDISVAIFIFAKRYFQLSAQDYRLLQKVAVDCDMISFDDILINAQAVYLVQRTKYKFVLNQFCRWHDRQSLGSGICFQRCTANG